MPARLRLGDEGLTTDGSRSASYFLFLKYRLIRRICSNLLNISASRLESGEDTPGTSRSSPGMMVDMLAANGDRATAFIVLGSIVIPLAVLAVVCRFFWTHRHDD